MNYTIFQPNDAELTQTLKTYLLPDEYRRAIRFISDLYVRHRQFDDDEKIAANKHVPKSIHSKKVRQILGRRYRATLDKLLQMEVVEIYQSWCAKKFSKGYRLTKRVLQRPFVKSGEGNRFQIDRQRSITVHELPPVNQRILAAASELTFDFNAAIEAIRNDQTLTPIESSWYQNYALLAQTDDFSSTVCEQNRFHYKLTFCPRSLRRFYQIRRSKLMLIDIKACQVMLHTSLYPVPCEEKTYFDQVCSTGQFWKLINAELKVPYDLDDPSEKDKLKKKFFAGLLYTEQDWLYRDSQIVKIFKKHFPQLFDLIMAAKAVCREKGTNMACKMQKLESEIVTQDAISKLQATFPEYIFLTIHDCIACEEELVDDVKKALTEAVFAKIGVTPGLDVKLMSNPIPPTATEFGLAAPYEMGLSQLPQEHHLHSAAPSLEELQGIGHLEYVKDDVF